MSDLSEFYEESPSPSSRYRAERDEAKRRTAQVEKELARLQERYDLVTSIDSLEGNA